MKTAGQRRSFFEFDAGVDAFINAFTSAMRQFQKRFVSNFIPPENTQRFHHGDGWRRPASAEMTAGQMKEHSAVLETSLNDILANDLGLLERSFAQISEAMQRQFAGMMYSTISEACDASGNVVDAQKEGSLPDSFMAMLEKIEFGVDKHGNVHMPQIHAAPEIADRMMTELGAAPPEFGERVEQLKQKKILEATEREAARRAKFARYGE
jgi:hypothetical protein